MAQKRYVLIDRDGTLNIDKVYLADPAGFEFFPGAVEGLARLAAAGFGLVVVTNQSGIGRGLITQTQLAAVHARMEAMLAERGVRLDGIYVCPHAPEEPCDCRKPKPGLGLAAIRDLSFDPGRAFLIGDKAADIELGQAIGTPTILVRTGEGWIVERQGNCRPDFTVDDLAAACDLILSKLSLQKHGSDGN
ncbi:MAG: HAD family hydrolase [Rhodospirillales bacterium]|nr:HAD family hydrolase [Rhodospirillales bacterium]